MDTKNGADRRNGAHGAPSGSQPSTLNPQLAGNGEDKTPKQADYQFPNSSRVYVAGVLHPDIRVPLREISLSPRPNRFNGEPSRLTSRSAFTIRAAIGPSRRFTATLNRGCHACGPAGLRHARMLKNTRGAPLHRSMMVICRRCTRSTHPSIRLGPTEGPNSKHQIPGKLQTPNSKKQIYRSAPSCVRNRIR